MSTMRSVSFAGHDSKPRHSAMCDCGTTETNHTPTFVGAGKGCYRQETTYKYVGDGEGTFALAEVRGPASHVTPCPYICCACIGCLLCSMPWVLFLGLPRLRTSILSTNPGTGQHETWQYDCQLRKDDREHRFLLMKHERWTDKERTWCCQKYGQGCPSLASPFDCGAGLDNWERGWADNKIEWCCKHKQVACRTPPKSTSGSDFDCLAGYAAWEMVWSDEKKRWCCHHRNRGCPETTTTKAAIAAPTTAATAATTTAAFDCTAGFTRWKIGWSEDKKSWCCKHHERGCPSNVVAATSMAYDCLAGLANWENMWSDSKRTWCCSHHKNFCPGISPSTRYLSSGRRL